MAESLRSVGRLEINEKRDGLQIRTTSFVGNICLGRLSITIQPKLRGMPLIQLFRYAYGLRDLRLFPGGRSALEKSGIQDLLVAQLIAEINDLQRKGIHRSYQQRRERLPVPRGRIDFQSLARSKSMMDMGLPCVHQPRIVDCLPNQILYGGLALASRRTDDRKLREDCQNLRALFDGHVQETHIDRRVVREAFRKTTRLTAAYRPAFCLIGILLGEEGPGFRSGDEALPVSGFLFDMNLFFQDLVGRFLKESLPGYEVIEQSRLEGMMVYDVNYNPRRKSNPNPRPDFVIRRSGQVLGILDAKYRDLWEGSLPPAMLYQLGLYGMSGWTEGVATIIYPTLSERAVEQRITIREPMSGRRLGAVHLRSLDLNRLAKLVADGSSVAERTRRELASQLVF